MGRDRDVHGSGARTNTNLTRRELVQRAAWALAAGTISAAAAPLRAEDISPALLKLSSYMTEARNSALPDKVLQETKHHILDTFAACRERYGMASRSMGETADLILSHHE